MERNIIVAGIGGQGSILASHLIAEATIHAYDDEYRIRVGETFGASQRGGAVASHVRIGEAVYSPLVGKGKADLILALEPLEGLRVGVPYLSTDGLVIMNTKMEIPVDVKVGTVEYPTLEEITGSLQDIGEKVIVIDGSRVAATAGSSKVLSVVMLGAAFASGMIPVAEEIMLDVIAQKVPPKTVEMNMKAFEMGKDAYFAAADKNELIG
jgi:indolepyruvate ferredoxin oxidoreductase beta subunit